MRPNASIVVETLDETHGSAMHAWEQAGRPEPPTRVQTEELRRGAMEVLRENYTSDSKGDVCLEAADSTLERGLHQGALSILQSNFGTHHPTKCKGMEGAF